MELLALKAVEEDGDCTVRIGARDAPRIMLTGDKSTFAVPGIAV
jgi:hypothetical protein